MKLISMLRNIINKSGFKKMKDERGFTLVETLLAIAVLAIIGVGVALALATSSKIELRNDMNQRARNFAEQEMESLNYPVSNRVDSGTGYYAGFTASISASLVSSRTAEQQVSIQVTGNNVPSYTLTDYKVP